MNHRFKFWPGAAGIMRGLALMVLLLPMTVMAADKRSKAFDHDATGFFLTGQHRVLDCESCHIRGIFRGIPRTCEGCHGQVSQIAASLKPISHVHTNAPCDDCHTDNNWTMVRMDHSELTGACFSCHNGVQATGKPVDHIQSTNECDDCHLTIAWVPAGFDHFGITSQCVTCHNGVTATGKTPDHLPSSDSCEVCHSTRAWVPAGFDHSDITSGCSTCHNGVTATGKDPGHFITTQECDVCHRTTAWEPVLTFDHQSAGYPGDHTGSNPACIDCHTGNSETISWPFAAYQPECAACHADDYNQGEHDNRPVTEMIDCAGTCHEDTPRHSVFQSRWD